MTVVALTALAPQVWATRAWAAPTYDMRQMLSQPNPFAAPHPAARETPTARPADGQEPLPMAPASGVTRLYDIRILLRRPHPLAGGGPAPAPMAPPAAAAPGPPVTPPRPTDDMPPYSGVTRLYDVRMFFSRSHPFAPELALPAPPPPDAAAVAVAEAAVSGQGTTRQSAAAEADGKDPDDDFDAALDDDLDPNDPFEPVNRFIFKANLVFLDFVLGPVVSAYRTVLPEFIQDAVSNALDNVRAPIILVNDILQAEPRRAWDTTARFLVNSIAGLGGTIDVADKIGIEKHNEDFGQTLAVWGVGEGVYLVLPLLGPSNPRDAIGKHFVDSLADPLGLWLASDDNEIIRWGLMGLKAVEGYRRVVDDLDKVRKTSIDFYGALRSLYRQKRRTEILNGKGSVIPAINFDLDEQDLDDLK